MQAFVIECVPACQLRHRPIGPTVVRRSLRALTTSWVGVGLTLPFYGAETFGLAAIGQHAYERSDPSLVAILEAPDRRA